MSKKSFPTKPVIIVASALIVVAAATFGFMHWHKTSDHTTKTMSTPSTSDNDTKSVNDVNLDPSTPSDNDAINGTKNGDDGQQTPISASLSANVTYAQVNNGNAQIRLLVTGASSGTCTIELVKQGQTAKISKTAAIVIKGTVTTCDGFDVPVGELSKGEWTINSFVTASGSASQPTTATLEVP